MIGSKIVAIRSSGCSADTDTCDHLVIPIDVFENLDRIYKEYRNWYHDIYCKKVKHYNHDEKYKTFIEHLKSLGCRETISDELFVFEED